MPIAERAKQFARELSDETIEKINDVLVNLKTGEIITVVYYGEKEQEYLQLTGTVAKVYEYEKLLQIASTKIRFEDIYDIILADK